MALKSGETYPAPRRMRRADGSARYAHVTFLILNDSYLPGALIFAYSLRRQKTQADLVCLVTPEITADARYALNLLFDHVIEVESIFTPHHRRHKRQDIPYLFTRLHVLRLGLDGDLGPRYEKIVVSDADILPLRHYDHLFALDAPAGTINEQKTHLLEHDEGRFIIPESAAGGKWKWHELYEPICPHGHKIPEEITDRVEQDVTNMGVNTALMVLEPSLAEFDAIRADIERPETLQQLDAFRWPDMQYLTLRWSGQWTNLDLRFTSLNGYPMLSALFGTHFAGFKPWYVNQEGSMAHYARFDDFQYWLELYNAMLRTYPRLQKSKRLRRLQQKIETLSSSRISVL